MIRTTTADKPIFKMCSKELFKNHVTKSREEGYHSATYRHGGEKRLINKLRNVLKIKLTF